MGATPERSWAELAALPTLATSSDRFDPDSLDGLPEPAARWLRRVVQPGAPLADAAVLSMVGRIKIGRRWMPFEADQILRSGVGFVWKPIVGGRLMRFVGADLLTPDDARMEFRLHGVIPVARASGPDTARSAAGRLAAETVAWLPQATTPQAGAPWRAVDDDRAVVSLTVADLSVDVEISVGPDGRLTAFALRRWNDAADPPRLEPFGARVTSEQRFRGAIVAGSGTVGWGYGTDHWDEGVFFRYTLTSLETI